MWLCDAVKILLLVCCGLFCCEAQQTILVNETGTIQNNEYPYSIIESKNLIWTFNITTKSLVYLNLENVQILHSDELSIFDGFNNHIWNNSNTFQKQFYILDPLKSNISLTVSKEEALGRNRRFQAYFTARNDFNNELYYSDAKVGVIKAPVYSQQNTTVNFTWFITEKPYENIYLAFRSFNLTDGFLFINNDLNFTGSTLPEDIVISAGNVEIALNANIGSLNQDFELFYSYMYPNCSEKVTFGSDTEKRVSLYGAPTEVPVQCFVIVEGPENSVLSVDVVWNELSSPEHPDDVLLVLGDGPSRFSPVLLADSPANRKPAPNVITKGNRLWIGYSYYSSLKGINASVDVFVHNQGLILAQPGNFGLNATISNQTLASNSSVYLLSVRPDQQIIATVSQNTTLVGENRLSFFDGGSPNSLLAEFNANDTFYPVISTKNEMYVIAKHFERNQSFEASFVAAHKGNNLLSLGSFGNFDVNEIGANSSRSWVIAPFLNSTEKLISLTVTKAVLTSNLTMTIHDGPNTAFPIAYELSNLTLKSTEIHIQSEKGATVVFRNKGDTTPAGQIADLSYQIVATDCNQSLDLRASKYGVIRSLNYPNFYPANAKCEWHITSDNYTLLSFKSLNLSADHSIYIFSINGNETKLLRMVNGNDSQEDILLKESHILLNWTSVDHAKSINVEKGFEIEVYSLDCAGTFDGSVKAFSTPDYPQPMKNSTLCIWVVDIPAKQSDKVEIIDLSYLTSSVKSSGATLTAYEGKSMKSPPVTNFSTTNFLSRTNSLTIKYNYTSDAVGGTAYSFTYEPHVCNQLCNNGLCLHDSWKCNGVNDCGDFTDETNCQGAPIIQEGGGVSVTSLVVAILLCLTIGAVGAIAAPIVWRKVRAHGRNYHEFRNSVDA